MTIDRRTALKAMLGAGFAGPAILPLLGGNPAPANRYASIFGAIQGPSMWSLHPVPHHLPATLVLRVGRMDFVLSAEVPGLMASADRCAAERCVNHVNDADDIFPCRPGTLKFDGCEFLPDATRYGFTWREVGWARPDGSLPFPSADFHVLFPGGVLPDEVRGRISFDVETDGGHFIARGYYPNRYHESEVILRRDPDQPTGFEAG